MDDMDARSSNDPSRRPVADLMQVSRAAATYFGLVFGAGFIFALIRVPFLLPRLGVRYSELLEMPLMFVVIIWSARFVVRRFALGPALGVRLSVGCVALALLILAELAVAYYFQGQSPDDNIATRDAVSGGVYLAMLGLFALMPLLVLRRSGSASGRTGWRRSPGDKEMS